MTQFIKVHSRDGEKVEAILLNTDFIELIEPRDGGSCMFVFPSEEPSGYLVTETVDEIFAMLKAD